MVGRIAGYIITLFGKRSIALPPLNGVSVFSSCLKFKPVSPFLCSENDCIDDFRSNRIPHSPNVESSSIKRKEHRPARVYTTRTRICLCVALARKASTLIFDNAGLRRLCNASAPYMCYDESQDCLTVVLHRSSDCCPCSRRHFFIAWDLH